MRHENPAPQIAAAPCRRSLAALSTMLVVISVLVVLATITELGRAIDWIVAYLIPVAVILGVVVGTFVLLAWEGGKVYDRWDQHR